MILRGKKKTIGDEWCTYFCDIAFGTIAKCTQKQCPRWNNCASARCLSKICFLYCRWKAECSSELSTELPLHQVGSSNNILNKICHGNDLWFPFFQREKMSKAEATHSCFFHLTLCTHPIPSLISSISSLTFPSLFFFSVCLSPNIHSFLFSHSLTRHFLRVFQVPSTKLVLKATFAVSWVHENKYFLQLPVLQVMVISRQNGKASILVIYFTSWWDTWIATVIIFLNLQNS